MDRATIPPIDSPGAVERHQPEEETRIAPTRPAISPQPSEPEAEAPALAARRGHQVKISVAVQALRQAGRLPPHLRPVERDRRIIDWLKAHGYAGDKVYGHRSDLPSPSALARYFKGAGAIG